MTVPPVLKHAYDAQEREEKEWGQKTVVFLMVGSFYEVYGARAEEVCRICNIVLTRKNKNVEESLSNPKMCGFPCYNRSRFVQKMVDEGYSVVIYDQKGEDAITREKIMVFSPMLSATIAQTPDEEDDEFFRAGTAPSRMDTDRVGMSIMMGMGACSVVIVNLTSGAVSMSEVIGCGEPSRRFIEVLMAKHEPVEVFWSGEPSSLEWFRSSYPAKKWTTSERLPKLDIPMQETILIRAFPAKSGMGVHETIGVERWPLTSLNLAWVVDLLYRQWPLVVNRLSAPVWGQDNNIVEYLPHTMRELHLSHGEPSLVQVMDKTCTVMGRRRFRAEWFHPKGSADALMETFDAIDDALRDYDRVRMVRRIMASLHDWECTMRRFHARMFSVRRVLCLIRDLESLDSILETSDLVGGLRSEFIVENLEAGDWSAPMTRSVRADPVEIEFTGPDPLWVLRTKLGIKTVPEKIPSLGVKALGLQETGDEIFLTVRRARLAGSPDLGSPFTVKQMAQVFRIYHPEWTEWNRKRKNEHLEVQKIHRDAFNEAVDRWFTQSEHRLGMILSEIIALDLCYSRAEVARKYGLVRPQLDGPIEIKDMRNPIMEALDSSRQRFVCNDFILDMDERGILLFGQNSSGKCFSPDTLALTLDGRAIPISSIRTGDTIRGPGGSPRVVLGVVRGEGKLMRIIEAGKVIMRTTHDHIMLVNGKGLMRLDQCGSSVELIRDDGSIIRATVEEDGIGSFVGLVISGNQLFCLADGTIAHNSTYVKSIGMNVWLAQTGHFVFASSMSMRPFAGIYTKIETKDNLYKGQSTFVSEMLDLRHILSRAGNVSPSIVLCDELTSGTETWSASSIVASTLHELVRSQGLCFVMTTHLHTLQLFRDVFEDTRMRVMHVHFSKEMDRSAEFRRILPGQGPVMYGIEIAEQIGFSDEFIRRCYHYRSTITDRIDSVTASAQPVDPKRSRFNRSIIMTRCEECGSTNDLQTHHVIEQASCSPAGRIPGTNQDMNSAWNLRVLCSRCHQKTHHH